MADSCYPFAWCDCAVFFHPTNQIRLTTVWREFGNHSCIRPNGYTTAAAEKPSVAPFTKFDYCKSQIMVASHGFLKYQFLRIVNFSAKVQINKEIGMATTTDDLNSFYQFALDAHQRNNCATIEQILVQWRNVKVRGEINEAIRDGLREIEEGGGKLVDEFLAETDAKYDLSLDT